MRETHALERAVLRTLSTFCRVDASSSWICLSSSLELASSFLEPLSANFLTAAAISNVLPNSHLSVNVEHQVGGTSSPHGIVLHRPTRVLLHHWSLFHLHVVVLLLSLDDGHLDGSSLFGLCPLRRSCFGCSWHGLIAGVNM